MTTPNHDWSSPHGTYPPGATAQRLGALARAMPPTRVGRECARLLRRITGPLVRSPIDISVAGLNLRCLVADNQVDRAMFFRPGGFEQAELDTLRRVVPRDGVFIDIGANVGLYSAALARHMSDEGRILAIEANANLIDRLRFNIEANHAPGAAWPEVTVINLGVSDEEGTLDMVEHGGDLGKSRVGRTPDGPEWRVTNRVRCLALLDLLGERSVGAVDAIKVDVEGAEDRVLLPYLEDADPDHLARWILIEDNPHLWDGDLPGALETAGYRVAERFHTNLLYHRE